MVKDFCLTLTPLFSFSRGGASGARARGARASGSRARGASGSSGARGLRLAGVVGEGAVIAS